MICQSNEDYDREKVNVQALLDHRVDGLLVCISKTTDDFSHFTSVYNSQVPMVFLDRVCKEIQTDRVITDDFNGARLITSHLIENGCRGILHLGTLPHLLIGHDRQQGYVQALKDNNIDLDPELIIKCDTPAEVEAKKEIILSMAGKIDAVFAVNDFTAVAVMNLLKNNGFAIPEDIAVAGFGDDPIATIVDPPLTTVEQQGYQMGQEAMNLLIERLTMPDNESKAPEIKVFQVELKKRKSTQKS